MTNGCRGGHEPLGRYGQWLRHGGGDTTRGEVGGGGNGKARWQVGLSGDGKRGDIKYYLFLALFSFVPSRQDAVKTR